MDSFLKPESLASLHLSLRLNGNGCINTIIILLRPPKSTPPVAGRQIGHVLFLLFLASSVLSLGEVFLPPAVVRHLHRISYSYRRQCRDSLFTSRKDGKLAPYRPLGLC